MTQYNPNERYEEYLGDGVYASYDGYHIWLTTMNGDRIAIEPAVFMALVSYKENFIPKQV